MTNLPAADPKNQAAPESAPAPLVGAAEFEFHMREFWEKNRNFIYLVIAAVLLAVIGREAWQYFAAESERATRAEFARAEDKADKLAAFATAHGGHALAGVALMRIADQKYDTGDFKGAAEHYAKAAGALPAGLPQARAKLGEIMARLGGGDKAGAETALKAYSADTALPATIRAEAAYHLAAVQAELGKKDEALKSIEQITKIELGSAWARNGNALRLSLEGPAPAATPALTLKPGGE
jgi:predicted negative regulator of RcsB-dependent stress response